MEVHAHSHTARKKWSHYFWEFFMLFLAVTLGFFVENKREHYIEHKREKDYIGQLVEDLKSDTAFFSQTIVANTINQERMDRLILLLRNFRDKEPTDELYYLARSIPSMGISPVYNNRTFEQMKNSGMLRLVRNSVLDSITNYYESLKDLDIRVHHRSERLNNLFIASEELFDGWTFNAIADSGFIRISPSPPLINTDKQSLSKYVTRLGYYKITDKLIMEKIKYQYIPSVTKLISFLKSKYHID